MVSPMHTQPCLYPLPTHRIRDAQDIAKWAQRHPGIRRVYLARDACKPGTKPVYAVELTEPDHPDAFANFFLNHNEWEWQISETTGEFTEIELAHPRIAPSVWRGLTERCCLVYERA